MTEFLIISGCSSLNCKLDIISSTKLVQQKNMHVTYRMQSVKTWHNYFKSQVQISLKFLFDFVS